jgi:hypothetical protein
LHDGNANVEAANATAIDIFFIIFKIGLVATNVGNEK